jgi:hypothetical protein
VIFGADVNLRRALPWIMVAIFSLIVVSGCKKQSSTEGFSRTVTFRTPEPAPAEFDAWSFHWSYPRWDAKAQLDYIVLQPNDATYAQAPIPQNEMWNPQTDARSEFSAETSSSDPSVFFGKKINFTFRVDKGFLIFSPDGFYTFTFYKGGLGGTVVANQTAVMDGD